MAITWTIIVLGALMHGMHSDASDPNNTMNSNTLTTSTTSTIIQPQVNTVIPTQKPASTTQSMQPSSTSTPSQSSPAASTQSPVQTTVQSPAQTPVQTPVQTHSVAPSASSNTTGTSSQAADSNTTQAQPSSTDISSTNAVSTVSTHNPVNPLTTPIPQGMSSSGVTTAVPTQSSQKTTLRDSSTTIVPTTTQSLITHNKSLTPTESSTQTTTNTQTNSVTSNAGTLNPTTPVSTSAISLRHQTSEIPTTTNPITLGSTSGQLGPDDVSTTRISITKTQRKFDMSNATEGDILFEACKALGPNMKGQCSVIYKIEDKKITATFTIDADQLIKTEIYNPPEQKKNRNEENTSTVPDTMIAILASCGALVLILCCFAAYCTHHRRSYRKNQQHLTEEMQTVENGYHDNPTLEVMEVQPEMQEKKLVLNGEFNDSWIVPIDNLLKEDIPDEEDTHL